MTTLYNKQDVDDLGKYKDQYRALEIILKSQEKAVRETKEKMKSISDVIIDLSSITEFYESKYALQVIVSDVIYKKGGQIRVKGVPEIERSAVVYINANHPKEDLWGCKLLGVPNNHLGEQFLGSTFTKENALMLAKRWVAKGEP